MGRNLRFGRLLPLSLLLVYLVAGLTGCGDDDAVTAPDASEFVSQGWSEYAAGNYHDAIAKYEAALIEDPDNSEAYNGIGWSKARLDQIQEAIEFFNKSVTKDVSNADAHAGLAGAYFASDNYERAIASAELVLILNQYYESHHDDIKVFDIRILLAECHYNLGDYNAARTQLELLGDSGKSLDPARSTYLADLLCLIEEIAAKGI